MSLLGGGFSAGWSGDVLAGAWGDFARFGRGGQWFTGGSGGLGDGLNTEAGAGKAAVLASSSWPMGFLSPVRAGVRELIVRGRLARAAFIGRGCLLFTSL